MASVVRGGVRAQPSYYVSSINVDVSSPEKRLLRAVLLDAIEELKAVTQSARTGNETRHRRLMAWFSARDAEWPFSFENVCEQLALNPDCVRSRLRILAQQPSIRARRTRHMIK